MLVCLTTVLVGFTFPLSTADNAALTGAKKGCERIYPTAPCLVKFIKKEDLVYNALCGEKVKKK